MVNSAAIRSFLPIAILLSRSNSSAGVAYGLHHTSHSKIAAALLFATSLAATTSTSVSVAAADVPGEAVGGGTLCNADDSSQECLNADSQNDIDDEGVDDDDGYDNYDDHDHGNFDSGDEENEEDCVDEHKSCKYWSEHGECEKNPQYMLFSCRDSCNTCDRELHINEFGKPQLVPKENAEEVRSLIESTESYMQSIWKDPQYEPVWSECQNKESRCSKWALRDGCDDNPNYMKYHCAPACQSCDLVLEKQKACGLDPNGVDAIEKGGMNGLFERMVKVAYEKGFEPKVWSRPLKNYTEPHGNNGEASSPSSSCETDITNPCNNPDGPWVLTLENFISSDEISSLLDWGSKFGYERSMAGDEIVEVRTSAHSWCVDDCYKDPIVVALRQRIVDVTGIPDENYECLQLLKYEVGQFYKSHNDFIEKHTEQSHGPRLLTFFIYFDEVEEGGGTRFPKLNNLTVVPKRGRALIWPSVRDDNPFLEDERTEHEAMAVVKGQKFAANAWVHMRDFQTPYSKGCPG